MVKYVEEVSVSQTYVSDSDLAQEDAAANQPVVDLDAMIDGETNAVNDSFQVDDSIAKNIFQLDGAEVQVPQDLYIPPDYMRVLLENFQGPFDLLLYLIRKSKIDILNLNVVSITEQYMQYINLMKEMKIDLAAEYLLMAATLINIKSRLLLPRTQTEDEEDEGVDPRAELVRRLQIYEQFRDAAMELDGLPRIDRDFFEVGCMLPTFDFDTPQPICTLDRMLDVLSNMYRKKKLKRSHFIEREVLSVRERMLSVLDCIRPEAFTAFESMFKKQEGAMGVVVSFLAILELQRQRALEISQSGTYANIYVKKVGKDNEY